MLDAIRCWFRGVFRPARHERLLKQVIGFGLRAPDRRMHQIFARAGHGYESRMRALKNAQAHCDRVADDIYAECADLDRELAALWVRARKSPPPEQQRLAHKIAGAEARTGHLHAMAEKWHENQGVYSRAQSHVESLKAGAGVAEDASEMFSQIMHEMEQSFSAMYQRKEGEQAVGEAQKDEPKATSRAHVRDVLRRLQQEKPAKPDGPARASSEAAEEPAGQASAAGSDRAREAPGESARDEAAEEPRRRAADRSPPRRERESDKRVPE